MFFFSFLISLTDACCLDFTCFICIYRDCVCVVLLHVHSLVSYKVPATCCSARRCWFLGEKVSFVFKTRQKILFVTENLNIFNARQNIRPSFRFSEIQTRQQTEISSVVSKKSRNSSDSKSNQKSR